MKIALDVHGGDFGIEPNLRGAILAASSFDCEIIAVGRDTEIRECLRRVNAPSLPNLTIVHAPDMIEMSAEPVQECRSKPDSSMMVCADLVAEGKADAFVTAGNSGAAMVASLLKIKRMPGVMRPAIAVPFPTVKGTAVLMDGGANMDTKPWHLVQFAVMGSIYAKQALGVKNPSVGVLSVGEEETKGNDLVRSVIPLLKKSGLNYYGPVEGRDIPAGTTDVTVCDGFVGNICLKISEGVAEAVFTILKKEIAENFSYKLGAFLMKGAFRKLKHKLNPDEFGGAPLLGVNGTVIICHGRSNSTAIFNGIRVARELVRSNANSHILKALSEITDTRDDSPEKEGSEV